MVAENGRRGGVHGRGKRGAAAALVWTIFGAVVLSQALSCTRRPDKVPDQSAKKEGNNEAEKTSGARVPGAEPEPMLYPAPVPVAMEGAPNRCVHKWGFIDREGRMVIPAQYDRVRKFHEGLARFAVGGSGGLLAHTGYDPDMPDMDESMVLVSELKQPKWGFLDMNGGVVVGPCFSDENPLVLAMRRRYSSPSPRDFHEGLAVVDSPDGGKTYIDRTGRVAPMKNAPFQTAGAFSCGRAAASKDGTRFGYIDANGNWAVWPMFVDALPFTEGLGAVAVEVPVVRMFTEEPRVLLVRPPEPREYGFVDTDGRMVIGPKYSAALPFSEGLAAVEVGGEKGSEALRYVDGGKWGFIDKTGRMVIDPNFSYAGPFSEGLAAVEVGGRWERDRVGLPGKYGFIDKTGRFAIDPAFDDVRTSLQEGLAPVRKGDKWGFVDKAGRTVIDFSYDDVHGFEGGLAFVKKNGAPMYIDRAGKVVWRQPATQPASPASKPFLTK
jgi:hypothetical protein